MVMTFFCFTIFTMACALAPSWPALLVFRLLSGVNASSPITVVGGIYADIWNDPKARGRSMALFMAVCFQPPLQPNTTDAHRQPVLALLLHPLYPGL
jgi:MFS family permease